METVTADRWLYTKLSGDTTLMGLVTGIYQWPVPKTAAVPYVLIQEQSALDVQPLGVPRIMVNALFLVRVVAASSSWLGSLSTAADRIDALLQGSAGSVAAASPLPAGNVWACVRESPFRLVEETATAQYRHLGGIYRLYVK